MKTGMGNSRLPGCIELSVPAVKITSMTDPILISDLRYFATPSALARATVFAEGVSVLDLEDLKRPGSWVQGLVPSNPLHIVELETTWPGRFVCTCGAQSWSPGATEHLCEHAAAVLVRSLTSSTEDPRGALEELRDDADLAVALGTAWAELVQRAVRRDAEGSVPLNRLRDIAEWSGVHVSLRQAGLSVAAWASPEQLERFLLHEVEWHLGEDGEGDLSPQSSAIHEVADLLCWGEMPAVAATVPARLAAARRVRSALGPETSAEDMLRWRYLSLLRLGGVSAEPRREERLRLAREVVALEERHRSPRRPLGPDLVRTWDEDMRAAGLEEARRRIDSLLRLIDEEGGDEIVPGDGARDPLLLLRRRFDRRRAPFPRCGQAGRAAHPRTTAAAVEGRGGSRGGAEGPRDGALGTAQHEGSPSGGVLPSCAWMVRGPPVRDRPRRPRPRADRVGHGA